MLFSTETCEFPPSRLGFLARSHDRPAMIEGPRTSPPPQVRGGVATNRLTNSTRGKLRLATDSLGILARRIPSMLPLVLLCWCRDCLTQLSAFTPSCVGPLFWLLAVVRRCHREQPSQSTLRHRSKLSMSSLLILAADALVSARVPPMGPSGNFVADNSQKVQNGIFSNSHGVVDRTVLDRLRY